MWMITPVGALVTMRRLRFIRFLSAFCSYSSNIAAMSWAYLTIFHFPLSAFAFRRQISRFQGFRGDPPTGRRPVAPERKSRPRRRFAPDGRRRAGTATPLPFTPSILSIFVVLEFYSSTNRSIYRYKTDYIIHISELQISILIEHGMGRAGPRRRADWRSRNGAPPCRAAAKPKTPNLLHGVRGYQPPLIAQNIERECRDRCRSAPVCPRPAHFRPPCASSVRSARTRPRGRGDG